MRPGILVASVLITALSATSHAHFVLISSAAIQNPVVPPVLLDGIFAHTERPTQNFEGEIPIPNINCQNCVLQVIEFMGARSAGPLRLQEAATIPLEFQNMLLAPGTRIGVYEVESALGAGGVGAVYRARDTRLGRRAGLDAS